MIDLHSHILPGIDDGAKDLNTSIEMAKQAVNQGITVVAATPHYRNEFDWQKIQTLAIQLSTELKQRGIALEVIPGAELFIDPALEQMGLEQIPTYNNNGKYCLIEFPMLELPYYVNQVLFSLAVKGITPVIAHPERYVVVGNDPNIVREWIDNGYLLQMNAGSLIGMFGEKVKKTSEIMLQHQMVHLIASDAHSANRRSFILDRAAAEAKKFVSQEIIHNLVQTNSSQVVTGEPVKIPEPLVYKRKKRFWFF